jgi:hypothetical protein
MQHGVRFFKWRESGEELFEHLGWSTSLWDCVKLRRKKNLRKQKDLKQGRTILFQHQGQEYKINGTYEVVNQSNFQYIDRVYEALQKVLDRFERVTVVSVGIKEQLIPNDSQSDLLRKSITQYRDFWESAQQAMSKHRSISFHETPDFGLSAFNPYDTHWNSKGNELFARYIASEFNNFQ